MTDSELGRVVLSLCVLLSAAHFLGYISVRLRQPRVIGEIVAGILLGPSLFARLAPTVSQFIFSTGSAKPDQYGTIAGFIYSLGLLLLMFTSGAETRNLFCRQNRWQTAWLAGFGTGLPFLITLACVGFLPLSHLMGPGHQRSALILVIGIAIAVTSIPVISRIFFDLKILHTRFASIVLGVAVIEDIVLWALLAVALALASSSLLPRHIIAEHIAITLLYFAAGLSLGPAVLRQFSASRWNIVAKISPVGYVIAVLFAYTALAAALNVSLVFASFLAGFGFASEGSQFNEALDSISKFSFAVFIPIYFAIVGYKIDLRSSFSISMLLVFLVCGCALKIVGVAAGAKLAGFSRLDTINLAFATNARGGPGIVLASVALDAGIINPLFYTTLVLTALITSQAAGAWLGFVLRKGWPLLSVASTVEVPTFGAAVRTD
jgi:Kef-type K+ transport system membrane component KefB